MFFSDKNELTCPTVPWNAPYNALFNWLLKKEDRKNAPERFRLHVFLGVVFITSIFMWSYAILGVKTIAHPSLYFGFVYATAHLLSILVYKRTYCFVRATYTMLIPGGLFQSHYSVFTGGFASHTMVWVSILPLIAGVIIGPYHAAVWGVLSLSMILTVGFLDFGHQTVDLISHFGGELSQGMVLFGMTAMNTGFTAFLIGINRRTEDKLRSKSLVKQNFLRVLVHDIATPVMVLGGKIRVLQKALAQEMGRSPQIKRDLDALERNTQKISRQILLVEDLEAADSGKRALRLVATPLAPILERVRLNFEETLERKRISLEIDFPAELVVLVHPIMFESQILNNVISNAIKFSHAGSTVFLTVRETCDCAILEVRDYGVGMCEETLNRVFEPYLATTRTGTFGETGTGFGMPIVKMAVDLHGGDIDVVSQEGKGTTVTIQLPLLRAKTGCSSQSLPEGCSSSTLIG